MTFSVFMVLVGQSRFKSTPQSVEAPITLQPVFHGGIGGGEHSFADFQSAVIYFPRRFPAASGFPTLPNRLGRAVNVRPIPIELLAC